jgi:hypothetical protein
MFILGTSSVLGMIPIDDIDLIAPIPQLLSVGFGPLGAAAAIVPLTLSAMIAIRFAQASVNFAASTRLPMVAGGTACCRPGSRGLMRSTRPRGTRSCSWAR